MGAGAAVGGAISGVGSIVGGKNSASAARDAARIQADAAKYAADLQKRAFDFTSEKLEPYVGVGNNLINTYITGSRNLYDDNDKYLNPIVNRISDVATFDKTQPTTAETVPDAFDYRDWGDYFSGFGLGADQQAALEKTPGYQFTLAQGLKSVQNSAAAKGRGVSGNSLTDAAKYATGLADRTFQDQFDMAAKRYEMDRVGQDTAFNQTLKGQGQIADQDVGYYNTRLNSILKPQEQYYGQVRHGIYDPLSELRSGITIGGNAAARVGNAAGTAANTAGDYLTSAGAATAGGILGANNALTGGYKNASNTLSNYLTTGSTTGTGLGGWLDNMFNGLFSPSSTTNYVGGSVNPYGYGIDDFGGGSLL